MESPSFPRPVFAKRAIVHSVLSPAPLAHLLCLLIDENPGSSDTPDPMKDASTSVPSQPCVLCQDADTLDATDKGVKETLMTLMGKVGLDLQTKHLNFCSFCSAQLGNLVALKREMDRLGEALGAMMVGLRSLFLSPENETTGPLGLTEGKEVEDEGQSFASPPFSLHQRRDTKGEHLLGLDKSLETERTLVAPTKTPNSATNMHKPRLPCSVPHGQVQRDFPPAFLFPCIDCNKTFCKAAHLKRHSSVHTGERPWGCRLCPRRFAQKGNLDAHLTTHLPPQEKPFPCPHCPKRFGRKDSLKTHIASHIQVPTV